MAVAELTLLGGFEVKLAGRVVDLPGQKDRALLAILALSPGAVHSRDKLASLLWGERGDQQARDSLKHGLTRLRQCLQPVTPPPIVADRQSVRLDATGMTIDVVTFERLLGGGAPEDLEQAAALYRGDLLDGIGLRDPAFEDWLLVERQRLRHRAEGALMELITQSLASGLHDRAATAARRLLSLDPLRESACRALMQTHSERAETAQALKAYETLRDRLHRDLGVKPEPETTRLYESIRQRRAAATSSPGPLRTEVDSPPKPEPIELLLPSKPSIAVLPFENLSGDPEQEYFADGMVEEIIMALSRMRWLFVIARNSSFTYKGRAVDVKQVGRELGVRYVLEGSVRKAGTRVRIAGQLIDASTGVHLWADHFDGKLDDIFDLQDRVTANVVGAIEPKLRTAEIERAWRKPTESLDAYDLYLRALALSYYNRDENRQALQLLRRVIELDPHYANAYGLAGLCIFWQKGYGWISPTDPAIEEGVLMARIAAEEARSEPEALWMAGGVLGLLGGDLNGGLALIERSLSLNPNSANACNYGSLLYAYRGDSEKAIALGEHSMRLSPHDPLEHHNMVAFGWAHFMVGQYEEAAAWGDKAIQMRAGLPPAFRMKAAAFGLLGRVAEAHEAVGRLLALNPNETLTSLRTYYEVPMKKPGCLEAFLDGMRKAGLPK